MQTWAVLFFSFLVFFFFLKLQLVLLEKFVKLHQWRSETLVWKGTAGGRTPPGFQIPWNQWSEWHWCFTSVKLTEMQRFLKSRRRDRRVGGGEMKTVRTRQEQLFCLFFAQRWFHTVPQGIFSHNVSYVLAPRCGLNLWFQLFWESKSGWLFGVWINTKKLPQSHWWHLNQITAFALQRKNN